jgi:DNA-binding MarR family transcriptional regulator
MDMNSSNEEQQPTDAEIISAIRAVLRIAPIIQVELERFKFTTQQYRTMTWLLKHKEARPFMLAHRISIGRPAMVAILSSLERKGYLRRKAVEGDARGVLISPTAKGKERIDKINAAVAKRIRDVFGENVQVLARLTKTDALHLALDADLARQLKDHDYR